MPQVLDYATPQSSKPDVLQRISATLPLSLGLIAYAVLCEPAATQRGYPPIDPVWEGVTFLWVFPVPLFVLCWPAGRFSRNALLLYGIISGYIDACTFVMMTPHRFSAIEALFNAIQFVPIHLLAICALAWASRLAVRLSGPRKEAAPTFPRRAAGVSAFILIGLTAVAFPFVYRQLAFARMDRGGRNRAAADWADHTAVIMGPNVWDCRHCFGDATVVSNFDTKTGLRLRDEFHMGYEHAYERRVRELLQLHGVPAWSQKSRLVDDADLVSMLTASTMTAVTEFPYDATSGIVLLRNCGDTKFGGSSSGSDLAIDSQMSGLNAFGNSPDTAYVGRLDKYPEVVFVRCGQKWVAACSDDGWILGYASRGWP